MPKSEKMVLKTVDVAAAAKTYAAILAIFGFVVGLFAAAGFSALGATTGFGPLGAGLGLAAIVAMPIMFAIIGFVMGAVSAFLYNLVAKYVGGVALEFEKK